MPVIITSVLDYCFNVSDEVCGDVVSIETTHVSTQSLCMFVWPTIVEFVELGYYWRTGRVSGGVELFCYCCKSVGNRMCETF